jgi:hypothetical protein
VLVQDEPLRAAGGRIVERHLLRVRHQPLQTIGDSPCSSEQGAASHCKTLLLGRADRGSAGRSA